MVVGTLAASVWWFLDGGPSGIWGIHPATPGFLISMSAGVAVASFTAKPPARGGRALRPGQLAPPGRVRHANGPRQRTHPVRGRRAVPAGGCGGRRAPGSPGHPGAGGRERRSRFPLRGAVGGLLVMGRGGGPADCTIPECGEPIFGRPTKPARARRRNDPATRTGPRSPESLTLDSLRVSESPNAHRTRPVARGPDRDRPCDIVSATVPPTTQKIGAPQLHRRCDSRFGPVPGRHSAAHRCMFLPETCEARRSSGL